MTEAIALSILSVPAEQLPEILACSNRMRIRRFGTEIHLCSIINAKSGACSEDCAFCAQSVHHQTEAEVYDLVSGQKIIQTFRDARKLPIGHFGIVTSGGALSNDHVKRIAEVIHSEKRDRIHWCVSLGTLTTDQLVLLKDAGLKRFHHNLETARSFFPSICSTHSYTERLEMIRRVKDAGLEVCCGGILGLGETNEQRVELAATLQREQVDAIPLNFLIPIPGTRCAELETVKPMDILRCIAMFRMMNPQAELKVCAGRIHLCDLQSMIFYAGATGIMIGPLLTVAGRAVEEDLQMLRDLEIEFE